MILALLLGCIDSCRPVDGDDPWGDTLEPPKGKNCVEPHTEDCVDPDVMPVVQSMTDDDNGILNCLQGSQKPDCFVMCNDEPLHITKECEPKSIAPTIWSGGMHGTRPLE